MSKTSIVVVTKRVSASAHVRHAATVNVTEPGNVAVIAVPARRGPPGRESTVPGPPGPPGTEPDLPSLKLIFENQLI